MIDIFNLPRAAKSNVNVWLRGDGVMACFTLVARGLNKGRFRVSIWDGVEPRQLPGLMSAEDAKALYNGLLERGVEVGEVIEGIATRFE